MGNLYRIYINKLIEVNDETKTIEEHYRLIDKLNCWLEGVKDGSGTFFNGDYYYIDLIDRGLMKERPMCSGVFLDWKTENKDNDSK